jgi:5'-nucleotidase
MRKLLLAAALTFALALVIGSSALAHGEHHALPKAAKGGVVVHASGAGAAKAGSKHDTHVQLLAFNDFHGNVEPPTGSGGRIQIGLNPDGSPRNVDAGGAEYFATHIKALRTATSNTLVVAAGDQIGASPLVSALFHDEPTIEAMNLWGTDVSGVGNHEFDEGVDELLRMQFGGCHPVDGCQDGDPFVGSLFQWLAANVFWKETRETILPAYEIHKVGNAKIAFIGLTLEGTPLIVSQAGIEDVYFTDEIETVNALVPELRHEHGVRTIVVLVHEGGNQNPPFSQGFENINGCENVSGPIVPIAEALDPQVDVIVSAHTHRAYNCRIDGRPVTSAASFGRLITDIDLVIDHQTKDVKNVTVQNRIVTRDVPRDPDQVALLSKYDTLSRPIADRIVGHITADITQAQTFAGESALGDVIADAQQWGTSQDHHGAAVVAFMNPGGIRADLLYAASPRGGADGEVTYRELFNVQPFTNYVVTKTFTGAQIYRLLEQQWTGPNAARPRILQVSRGFTYTYDMTRAGDKVVPGSVVLNGDPVDPLADYRVTMNSFLADGGDGFSVFREGRDTLVGQIDVDVVVNYFHVFDPIAPGPRDRITRLG